MNIHATDPATYKSCRRKFYYGTVLRLKPKEEHGYFSFGKAGHAALHAHYTKLGDPLEVFQKEATELGVSWTDIEDGLLMLQNYLDTYKDEVVGEVVSAEETREISFGDVNFKFTIDLLMKVGNGYEIWDHKFFSSFPNERDLVMSEQATSYIWGLRKMGYWPLRFKLNVIRKEIPTEPTLLVRGGLSQAKTQLTTPALYRQALDKYGLDPTEYSEYLQWLEERDDPYCRRYTTTRSAHELDRFEKDLWDEMVDMTADRGYYRNPGMPCNYCLFYDLCRTDYEGGDMDLMIETYYARRVDGER